MKRILVLDDEQDVDFIFKVMLEDEIAAGKLQIDFFSNPQECLDDLARRPNNVYDYIFSDINMPQINGVQFSRILRNRGYRGPIAFISAYLVDDYEDDMKLLDINMFFSKPLNFNDIKDLLKL